MIQTGVSRILGPEPPEGLDGDARKGSVLTSEVAKRAPERQQILASLENGQLQPWGLQKGLSNLLNWYRLYDEENVKDQRKLSISREAQAVLRSPERGLQSIWPPLTFLSSYPAIGMKKIHLGNTSEIVGYIWITRK